MLLIVICAGSCTKNSVDTPAQLADVRVTAVSVNTAVVENKVITNGGSVLTAVGTCWSATESTPTLENSNGHTTNQAGSDGHFTDSLRGLTYNTKYYLRAYARNATSTIYGVVDSFYTLDTPFPLGLSTEGGTVIWVDSTGMHGLIVAGPQNVVSLPWAVNAVLLGGTSRDFGSGAANTVAIVAAGNNSPQTAAGYCHDLVLNGHDDWFLPSSGELQYFKDNMTFDQWLSYVMDMYWSSSETSYAEAYFVVIGGGASFDSYDKLVGKQVLPMRRF